MYLCLPFSIPSLSKLPHTNTTIFVQLPIPTPLHPCSFNNPPINPNRFQLIPKSLSPNRLALRNSNPRPSFADSMTKSSMKGFPPLNNFANVPFPELRYSNTIDLLPALSEEARRVSDTTVYPPPSTFPSSNPSWG